MNQAQYPKNEVEMIIEKIKGLGKLIILPIAILILFVAQPWVIVGPGQRGVLMRLGAVQKGVLSEGFHFKIPFVDNVVKINVQVQKNEAKADAASKDLQIISTVIATNYHLIPETVDDVYQKIGLAFEDKLIQPAVQEVIKAVCAKYTAEELIAKRGEVKSAIRTELADRLSVFNIKVIEVSVADFNFSNTFNDAIEAKQVAEQKVAQAKNELDRIKIENEQKISQAKAEAEGLKIQRQEITESLLKLREIENQRKAIEKWDGKLPGVTGGAMPFIQVK
ncbi:MAG: prohibitin family protein [Deltaproteobacteria bacterium]|nr:prohibitin family protein [Deltaproteobacteria bacterium]